MKNDKYYLVKTKLAGNIFEGIEDGRGNIIAFMPASKVELTESELIKLQTILRNEVAFHANMKGGKKFQAMFDKIRKVLDNE